MRIKILVDFPDLTVGKVYYSELSKHGDSIDFMDDMQSNRRWYYPDPFSYIEVEDESEQLTLRDQFAMAVIPLII